MTRKTEKHFDKKFCRKMTRKTKKHFDKKFCRKMTRKTKKNFFAENFNFNFLKFLVPKMELKTPKTSLNCLKLSF